MYAFYVWTGTKLERLAADFKISFGYAAKLVTMWAVVER